MKRILCRMVIFYWIFLSPVSAFTQYNAEALIPLHPDVVKKTLPNGFTYYLQENARPEGQVHFQMVIKAGSILETEEQRGFAHFLEHMVFNGSKHFPGNSLIDYLQSIGVEFGADLNAYTGYDETVYMLPMPNNKAETLDKAFFFFEDLLSGLNLHTADIDAERNIIFEEWRTTIGLNQRLKDQMYPLLYQGSRYLHRRPIGIMDVVTKVGNDEELRSFYRSWYRPDLTSLLIVGDFDEQDIEQRIMNTFGSMKVADKAPERKYYKVPAHDNTLVKIIKDKEITSTSVRVIRKIEPHKEVTLADLKQSITDIIYTYMTNQRLSDITQKPDAPFMYASSYAKKGVGARDQYTSFASVKSGEIIEGVKGLMRELYRIKRYGFTQEELDRKKQILINDVKRMASEENKLTTAQLMDALSTHVVYHQEYASLDFKLEFIQQVLKQMTLDDIHRLANTYIDESAANRVVIISAPEKEATPTVDEVQNALEELNGESLTPYQVEEVDAALMEQKPQPGRIVKEHYSQSMGITTLEFANGVSVALKPTTFKNDEIRFSSLRNGGYSLADIDNFDNASMAATLVNLGGLGQFSSLQLDQITSGKQVYVAPYIHRYTDGVTGFSSKADFETLLQLNYLTYMAPRKDAEQFKIFIDKKKEYNRNSLNSPDSYFADELNKVMMQNSPRTATLLTPAQLDQISLDKAYDFYRSRFSSAFGTRFFVVGSFEVDSIKPLLTQYLGSLQGTSVATDYIDHGIRPPEGINRHVFPRNTVDKSKVLIRFTGAYPASQRKRIEMGLLSDILTIRLNQKLREEIGGVYSPYARATILQRPYHSYRMDIYFTCSPENVDVLTTAAFEQIEEMQHEIKEENLEKVKKAWLKNREGSLKTNGYWRKVMEDQWTRGEDEKDFESYENHIQRVSVRQLSKLAQRYLNKKNYLQFILSPEEETPIAHP
ncbi:MULTISPECIES: M16 family metallopeptidase [unclassified Carboxylicivirga]|uniref:M16 family metallopeptidase n=1 Tax=Carboxylicivirga TaxID=1628153 RepID=UPI003D33CBA0